MRLSLLALSVLCLFVSVSPKASAQSVSELKAALSAAQLEFDDKAVDFLINSDHEGPIHILSMLKFREKAKYPANYKGTRATTGREAQDLYIQGVVPIIQDAGVERIVLNTMVGAVGRMGDRQEWDLIAVNYYPSREVFVKMLTSQAWLEAAVHKHAALERTQALVTIPGGPVITPPAR